MSSKRVLVASRGPPETPRFRKISILASILGSILGAFWLHVGFPSARKWLLGRFKEREVEEHALQRLPTSIFYRFWKRFWTIFRWHFGICRILYVCNANIQKYCISAGRPATIWLFCFTDRLSRFSFFVIYVLKNIMKIVENEVRFRDRLPTPFWRGIWLNFGLHFGPPRLLKPSEIASGGHQNAA